MQLEKLAAALAEKNRRDARATQSNPSGGLFAFVRYFWHILEPGRDFSEGWPMEAICAHLEAVARGDIKRLLINVPPGFAKSILCDVFFPAWLWGPCNRPDLRFVAFSYAAHLTERDNGRFRDLVRSHDFQSLWGDRVILTDEGKVRIANTQMGFKFASSVGGVGTGERGDVVLADDLHSVKEAESQVVRTETVRWFREAMQNRLNDLDGGAIIVIMQRVHEGDVSGCILEFYPEYVHLCIPMRYEVSRHCSTSIGWDDPRTIEGELAWPDRFSEESLQAFERLPYVWSGQYQQRPNPRGGGILPVDGWEVWDRPLANRYGRNENQFPDLEYVVCSVDPAYTTKQQNDFSGCVVLGVWRDLFDRPRIIVMEVWQEKLAINDLVNKLATTCKRVKADRLLIEAKASGISVAQEMQRLQGGERWIVDLINPGAQDKVARAYSIQHLLGEELPQGGRRDGVVYLPYVTDTYGQITPRAWAELLMSQAASFPKGQNDDMVDAFVQGMRHLRDRGYAIRSDEIDAANDALLDQSFKPSMPLYPV